MMINTIAKFLLLSVVLATSTLAVPINNTAATPEPATTNQALEDTILSSEVSPTSQAPATNESEGASLSEQAEEVRKDAVSTGNSAYLLYDYVLKNLLDDEVPAPAQSCFSEEREAGELDGHIHPDVDFLQRLVDDHTSLSNYTAYLRAVEMQYNETLNKKPVCGFCVRFLDLKASAEKVMTSLEHLINMADPVLASTLASQDHPQEPPQDDLCYGLCFEQQARVYLRYQGFAAVYIVNDVDGLVQQKLKSKNN